jgi:hypothetical protein
MLVARLMLAFLLIEGAHKHEKYERDEQHSHSDEAFPAHARACCLARRWACRIGHHG